jgi:hypothetical protein
VRRGFDRQFAAATEGKTNADRCSFFKIHYVSKSISSCSLYIQHPEPGFRRLFWCGQRKQRSERNASARRHNATNRFNDRTNERRNRFRDSGGSFGERCG